MASGRSFSRQIDDAARKLSTQLREASASFDAYTKKKASAQRSIAKAFMEIARVQAESIDAGAIAAHDRLSRDADAITEKRNVMRDNLRAQLAGFEAELAPLRERERAAESEHAAAVSAVEQAVEQVDEALAGQGDYMELHLRATDAENRMRAAQAKVQLAHKERATKQGAYEDDPVFMYLRKRGFGGPTNRAAPLVRTVDGWLASLCGYVQASKDYAALMALPDFLQEHAQQMQVTADDDRRRAGAFRRSALDAAGVDAVELVRAEKGAALERASVAVEVVQGKIESVQDGLNLLASWRDAAGKELLERMADAYADESLKALEARVAATPAGEDDDRLAAVRKLREDIANYDEELESLMLTIRVCKERGGSLESIKRTYKAKGYASSDYDIKGSRSSDLLSGFLLGTVASNDLWRGIESSVSYSPQVSSYRSSSSSGFGGGGFSSGGGFGGGGGFSTGGGF